jgi:hypothetical protein
VSDELAALNSVSADVQRAARRFRPDVALTVVARPTLSYTEGMIAGATVLGMIAIFVVVRLRGRRA